MKQDRKVIVIGAGVAGMATAIRLAVKGFEVEVYEKNNVPGGKLTSFKQDGFVFDAGPSLFTAPSLLQELFELANEPFEDYFSYTKQTQANKYFYEDGTVVNAFSDTELFANELSSKLGEKKEIVLKYLQNAEKLFNKTGKFFLNNSLHKIKSYWSKNFADAFKGVKLEYVSKNLNSYNQQNFNNPKTIQLFNRFATYNGSNPYKAPAMLSLIPHLEHNDGTFYPKGGMISITNALYKLALKKGVVFNFNTGIDRIIVSNKVVKGVVINDKNYYANTIISNCDAYFTYKNLLKNDGIADKILKQERSSSALIFYWGINKNFDQLDLHNILFSNNYKAEFDAIFNTKHCFNDPTVYINITSKCEPEIMAPIGKENWFVMINVPANTKINWEKTIAICKENIIKKINRILQTNIENFIETETVLHPGLIESRTSSYLGSLYGTSSNSKFAAFLRHSNFSSTHKGLYFVGGSVHPGGGIPLCLQSAKITANLI